VLASFRVRLYVSCDLVRAIEVISAVGQRNRISGDLSVAGFGIWPGKAADHVPYARIVNGGVTVLAQGGLVEARARFDEAEAVNRTPVAVYDSSIRTCEMRGVDTVREVAKCHDVPGFVYRSMTALRHQLHRHFNAMQLAKVPVVGWRKLPSLQRIGEKLGGRRVRAPRLNPMRVCHQKTCACSRSLALERIRA